MKQPEQLAPFLVNAKTASRLCGVGVSLFYQLNAAGQTPKPIKLNTKSLWSYSLLKLWADNGCPSRDSAAWQQLLKDKNADCKTKATN